MNKLDGNEFSLRRGIAHGKTLIWHKSVAKQKTDIRISQISRLKFEDKKKDTT